MTSSHLDDLGYVLTAKVTLILRPVHLESAEEAYFGVSTVHYNCITLPLEAKHAHVSNSRSILLITIWRSLFYNGHLNNLMESLYGIQGLLTIFTLLLLILHPHFYVELL
jgi:hypothetical protein